MNFGEIIRRYKEGSASPEEVRLVEEELEKQRQLNDLLYEELEGDLQHLGDDLGDALDRGEPDGAETEKFARLVQRSIRRAFVKAGIVITAVALSVMLFVSFGLSPLVDSLYYNPAEELIQEGKNEDSYIVNQRLAVDMGVYTELNFPLRRFDGANIDKRGYGVYNFRLYQSVYPSDMRRDSINGVVERGKITFYNTESLERTPVNFFSNYTEEGEVNPYQLAEWKDWGQEMERQKIDQMADGEYQVASISFSHMLTFQELQQLKDDTGVGNAWNQVETYRVRNNADGYSSVAGSNYGYWDMFSYSDEGDVGVPTVRVIPKDMDYEDFLRSESCQQELFLRMLDYMGQQEEFLKAADNTSNGDCGNYRRAAQYVRENGMMYSGIAVWADRETLEQLWNHPLVSIVHLTGRQAL